MNYLPKEYLKINFVRITRQRLLSQKGSTVALSIYNTRI